MDSKLFSLCVGVLIGLTYLAGSITMLLDRGRLGSFLFIAGSTLMLMRHTADIVYLLQRRKAAARKRRLPDRRTGQSGSGSCRG